MIIAGVDGSKNSTGICKFTLNDKLEIIDMDFIGFCTTKKWADKDDRIIFYKSKDYVDNIKKHAFMCDTLNNYLTDIDYVGFEGYAYGGSGNVFDVAEVIGTLKYMSYQKGSAIRIYAPGMIKKYFAFSGNANKFEMGKAYYAFQEEITFDLSHLPPVISNKDVKPTSDIIDAYAITFLLLEELRVRHGFKTLKTLHPDPKSNLKRIEVFNSVSKQQNINVLAKDFTTKD